MGIGLGLLLIAAGAILKFAVTATVAGVNVTTVGVILMVVGIVGIVLDFALLMPRRRAVTSAAPVYDDGTVAQVPAASTTVTHERVVERY